MSAPELAAEAGAAAERPRRLGAFYIVEHQLRGYRAYGPVTIASALGTPLLSLLAFGLGVGGLVSANVGPARVEGVSYLEFVFPALMCALVLQVWAEEAMFATMLGMTWRQTFRAMRATPLTSMQIAAGMTMSISLRALVTALLYLAVALLAGAMHGPASLLAIPAVLLTGLAFGLPLMAYSAGLEHESGQFALIGRFVVLPLTLFSGTMFPLTVLPIWLQWIGWVSPLWHGAQLARLAGQGTTTEPAWLVAAHVAVLLALAVVGWVLCVRVIRRRLER